MDRNFLNNRAFSLTEIACALGVMVVVLSALLPMGGQIVTKVNATKANADLNGIASACQQYYKNTGHWPAQPGDLQPDFLSPGIDLSNYVLNPQVNILIISSAQNSVTVVKLR